MLRLVKLNLYNYKLYKKMMVEWLNNNDSTFLKRFLFSDSYLDHDKIVNYFIYEEKNKNSNLSLTYFLYDTTINGFAGAVVFLENKNEINELNYFYEIAPFVKEDDYEEKMFDLSLIVLKAKKINQIRFNVKKSNIQLIDKLDNHFLVLSKNDCGDYYKFAIKVS